MFDIKCIYMKTNYVQSMLKLLSLSSKSAWNICRKQNRGPRLHIHRDWLSSEPRGATWPNTLCGSPFRPLFLAPKLSPQDTCRAGRRRSSSRWRARASSWILRPGRSLRPTCRSSCSARQSLQDLACTVGCWERSSVEQIWNTNLVLKSVFCFLYFESTDSLQKECVSVNFYYLKSFKGN